MKLDYAYFLSRRNLTTKKLISINGITSYEQFVELLDSLAVTPPSPEDVEVFFAKSNENNNDQKEKRVPTKTSRPRKSTARRSSSKSESHRNSQAGKNRRVRKKNTAEK